jgi:hypothetical protein
MNPSLPYRPPGRRCLTSVGTWMTRLGPGCHATIAMARVMTWQHGEEQGQAQQG